MKYAAAVLLLVATTLLYSAPAEPAEGYELKTIEGPGITVYFDEFLESAARKVVSLYPELTRELEARVGWRIMEPPAIVLINDRQAFQSMVGVDYVVGIAVPSKQLIIIDYTTTTTRPFSLRTILKHELCHLLLHEYIGSSRLPRWLDEGVAQWTSDGMAEIVMKRDRFMVHRAIRTGRILPLSHLDRSFPRSEQGMLLAYEKSKSVVEYIIQKHGPSGLRAILQELRWGEHIDGALSRSLGVSLEELEAEWHDSLRGRGSWIAFWSYHMYELLFVMAAMLSVVAFLRYLKRKRNYSRLDDDDDNDGDGGNGSDDGRVLPFTRLS